MICPMLRRVAYLIALAVLFAACGGGGGDGDATPAPDDGNGMPPDGMADGEVEVLWDGSEQPVGQAVVQGSEPAAFDFAPDGRLFFNLRQRGEVRWIDLDTWDPEAPLTGGELFAQVDTFHPTECGLMGLAVDPDFETNHFVYIYVTQPDPSSEIVSQPRVIRFTDVDGKGTDPTVIVDDLPMTNPEICAHVGGNLHFGPDGYLYVSVGNMEFKGTADDLDKLLGKILRLNKEDGSAAPGNPFEDDPNADPRVFAYGFRNVFDYAFHPETGTIYAADNGPGNCDELNIVEAGQDYGMPESMPEPETPSCVGLGGVDPIHLFAKPGMAPETFGSNSAPAGTAFLSGDAYPDLGVGFLVCEFNTQSLHYLEFEGPEQDSVARDLVLVDDCVFNVAVDDEGIIYYSSGDIIWRLDPAELP